MPEVITYDKESKNYQSTAENVAELLPWVEKQVKKALEDLQEDVKKNFFEEKEGNVTYKMDLVKKYLESCIQKDDFSINSVVVMAVQIGLESLGEDKYDVGVIDGLLKTNSGATSKTEKAIRKFQEDKKLKKIDGVPGKDTIKNLLDELGKKEIKPEKTDTPNDDESVKKGDEVVEEPKETPAETPKETPTETPKDEKVTPKNETKEATEQPDIKKLLYALEVYNGRILTEDFKQKIKNDGYDLNEIENLVKDRTQMEKLNRMYPNINKGQPSQSIDIAQYKKELEQINNVNNLIDHLPEASAVTVKNESQINQAKSSYDALTSNQQKQVKNTQKLKDAIDALKALKQNETQRNTEIQSKIKKAQDKINNLPTEITIDHKNQIESAREAANQVKDKLDPKFIEKLEKAEKALEQLINQAKEESIKSEKVNIESDAKINNEEGIAAQLENSEAKINYVKNLLKELPDIKDITIDKEDQIKEASDAYYSLDNNQSTKISPSELLKLFDAKKRLSEVKIQNVETLISALPNIDKVSIENTESVYRAKQAFKALSRDEIKKIDEEKQYKLREIVSKIEELTKNDILLHPLENQSHYGLKMDNIEGIKGTDILKNVDKLKAQDPKQVGGLGNSILDGIERYANIKFPNIDGISGKETTSHKNRFKSEKDVINYKNEHPDIKSFVLYFGGNTSNNDQTFNDIEKWAGWLSGQGIEPVLCTSIGVDLPKHTSKTNYKQYNGKRLVDLNARIRQLAQDHGYPLIDYALIDDNIKIGSDGVHPTSYNLMNRMLDDCLDKQKESE